MNWIETVLLDCRQGVRQVRHNVGFTVTVCLVLALGIGATTTIFSLIDALILRALPVHDPAHLVAIYRVDRQGDWAGISLAEIEQIQQHQSVFSGIFGRSYPNASVVDTNDQMWPINLGYVTGAYYSVLGIKPFLGRLIVPDDLGTADRPGLSVAVLSYDFWRRQYNGDPHAIGRKILIAGAPFIVIGVTPKGFFGDQVGFSLDVTIPITQIPGRSSRSNELYCQFGIARLYDGIDLQQARSQLYAIWPDIQSTTVPANGNVESHAQWLSYGIRIVPYPVNGFSYLREQFSNPLQGILGISAVVLLIACLSLATLYFAHASARQKEITTRLALGASSWRLMQHLIIQSLVLCIIGAGIGLAFAYWASRWLLTFWAGGGLPVVLDLTPDVRIIGFTAVIGVLVCLLFAVIPAWRASYQQPSRVLRETASGSRNKRRFGNLLIILQIALSVVAVSSGGLLVRSFMKIRVNDTGFRHKHILALELRPTASGRTKNVDTAYCMALVDQLCHIPGVRSAALSHLLPGSGLAALLKVAPSYSDSVMAVTANVQMVSPEFFQTMGVSLVAGRDFRWRDDTHAQKVAIISAGLAQQFFPQGDALGHRIRIGTDPTGDDPEIVGVVNDTRLPDVRKPWPYIVFIPYLQGTEIINSWTDVELTVVDNSPKLLAAIRQRVRELGREYVRDSKMLDEVIDNALVNERVAAFVAGFFTGMALLLAGVGLYGLVSYTVRQRTYEIGIRMALGAQRHFIIWTIIRESLFIVAVGIAIGLPCTLYGTRFLSHMLLNLPWYDPLTLMLTVVELTVVAVLASFFPALRAAKNDPMNALRYQ